MERVSMGERLGTDDLAQLASTPDILQLGMLADTVRRKLIPDGRSVLEARVNELQRVICDGDRRSRRLRGKCG